MLLHRLYIGKPQAGLRKEEKQKAKELAALLEVVGRAVARIARHRPLTLVDAAAGKGYVGLCAAELVLAPLGRPARVVAIERESRRVALVRAAAQALRAPGIPVDVHEGTVADHSLWPVAPELVVALHACGFASDEVIDTAVAVGARELLLAPCCVAREVSARSGAERAAERLGVPEHGTLRQAFYEAYVASWRTLRLEAGGYETEVAAFVAPTVTPHNLLWRARKVGEPVRMARAAERLLRLTGQD